MKPIVRPGVITPKQVYVRYAEHLLQQNPEWWSKGCRSTRVKHAFIYAKENNKVVEKMSWVLWKKIVDTYCLEGKQRIIEGETFNVGRKVGKIRGCRIERNMSKLSVNWALTMKNNLRDGEGKLVRVYHTSSDYCRIQWVKTRMLRNESCYNFDPAATNTQTQSGFKREFSEALKKDPFLKYRYTFYPLVK